jgi:hypothetical protein
MRQPNAFNLVILSINSKIGHYPHPLARNVKIKSRRNLSLTINQMIKTMELKK